uniref:Uncharacterized protein n=1 Tax=Zea mays TaxID=4577 RepID=A0A804RLL4_MAIZE
MQLSPLGASVEPLDSGTVCLISGIFILPVQISCTNFSIYDLGWSWFNGDKRNNQHSLSLLLLLEWAFLSVPIWILGTEIYSNNHNLVKINEINNPLQARNERAYVHTFYKLYSMKSYHEESIFISHIL